MEFTGKNMMVCRGEDHETRLVYGLHTCAQHAVFAHLLAQVLRRLEFQGQDHTLRKATCHQSHMCSVSIYCFILIDQLMTPSPHCHGCTGTCDASCCQILSILNVALAANQYMQALQRTHDLLQSRHFCVCAYTGWAAGCQRLLPAVGS